MVENIVKLLDCYYV